MLAYQVREWYRGNGEVRRTNEQKLKESSIQPRDVAEYADKIVATPLTELVPVLQELDIWRFPKSDLNCWIAVLDKFDEALEGIITSYELTKPQMNPFTPKDRELVLEILRMQRLLMENSTSRKLFSSFDVSSSDLRIQYARFEDLCGI